MWRGERGRQLVESILASENKINWYEWTGDYDAGKLPIPVLRKESELVADIKREIDALKTQLVMIHPSSMSGILYRLQGHYWQPNMSEALARAKAEDYLRLLGEFPLFAFEEAYDAWILNSENKFFPTVGEFKALLMIKSWPKKWRLQRLEKLVEKSEAN